MVPDEEVEEEKAMTESFHSESLETAIMITEIRDELMDKPAKLFRAWELSAVQSYRGYATTNQEYLDLLFKIRHEVGCRQQESNRLHRQLAFL